jgi:hypothetical protein
MEGGGGGGGGAGRVGGGEMGQKQVDHLGQGNK